MRKSIILVAALLAVLAASGCSTMTMGEKSLTDATRTAVDRNIINSKSTKADVRNAYGEPGAKTPTDKGGEFWYYSLAQNFIGGSKVKTLAVTFNDKGVVTEHQYDAY